MRQRAPCGWGPHGALGIGKGDKDRMHVQHRRNYLFFDAPVGLIFSLDFRATLPKRLGIPPEQTVVCGMSLGYPAFTPERIDVLEFVTWVAELKGD